MLVLFSCNDIIDDDLHPRLELSPRMGPVLAACYKLSILRPYTIFKGTQSLSACPEAHKILILNI